MSISCIAFIESNTSGTGRLFARAARQLGFRPVMVSAAPQRYSYVEEDHIEVLRANTSDLQHLLQVLRKLAAEQQIAGIMSSSDYFVESAAMLALELGLPGPSPVALHHVKNKFEQRKRLQTAGVPVPGFFSAVDEFEAAEMACQMGFPVVVKPCSGSGSYGVKLCRDSEEGKSHALALLAVRCNERGQPLPRCVLVEEMVHGPEFSVETFNESVVGITAKHLGKLPYFVETGHDFPAELDETGSRMAGEVALRALAALGLGWGPAHTELRITAKGACVIEVNPRLAGGFIPELVRLASGIDLIHSSVAQASGRQPEFNRTAGRHASIRFLLPAASGEFAGISGEEAAYRIPGVAQIDIYRKAGDPVHLQGDFRDRVGHVIAVAETGAGAKCAADAACRQITVRVKENGSTSHIYSSDMERTPLTEDRRGILNP